MRTWQPGAKRGYRCRAPGLRAFVVMMPIAIIRSNIAAGLDYAGHRNLSADPAASAESLHLRTLCLSSHGDAQEGCLCTWKQHDYVTDLVSVARGRPCSRPNHVDRVRRGL